MNVNVPPRPVDFIRGKCPGPVTLTPSRGKKLAALILSLGFAAFCGYILHIRFVFNWYDMMMAWISLAFFSALAVRALILLLLPRAACLTLDVDGFEVCGVFLCRRTAWQDASGFRVEKTGRDNHPTVTYDVLTPGTPKATNMLPDNYALSADDLAWLMEQWRHEALACQSLPQNALRH